MSAIFCKNVYVRIASRCSTSCYSITSTILFTSLISSAILCKGVDATVPNIVLVLTDDQGWNGTSVQMDPNVPGSKSDFYQTPRLEEMAAEGMRFSSGYSSAPVCSPTRAAVLTGKSPAQLQIADLVQAAPGSSRWSAWYTGYNVIPPAPVPLDPNQLTIPRIVKQSNPGYVTGHIGKWHLERPSTTTPLAAGYDFTSDPPLPSDEVDPWGVFQLSNVAGSFMEERVDQGEPFFLQVSYRAVHDPLRSRQAIRDKYAALPPGTVHNSIPYAAMTEDLDTAFGMVLDKIDQLGIADNTYVIFVSDNGGFEGTGYTSNLPLKKSKGAINDGGIKVPFIVKGPGVEPGSVSSVPVSTTDILSTVADLAGHVGPLPSDVEGASIRPLLENAGQLPAGMDHLSRNFAPNGELYWHWPVPRTKPTSAVRDGDYKLMVAWTASDQVSSMALYNLATDVGETTNLAASMPDKVAEMKAKLDKYLEDIDASFAYDVKQDVIIDWNASAPGADPKGWRSTIDLQYKGRETWNLGTGSQAPARQPMSAFQPGLPKQAFVFGGNDKMERLFFQVGDDRPRRSATYGTADFNRSATLEFWVRLDSLSQEQVLFESGDGSAGISATIGDADGDGLKNDLRFRLLGKVGADNGAAGTLKDFTLTTKIDRFADPTQDFIHVVAVFNDDPANRYQEIYVNGALAQRTNWLLGANESPQWDGYDGAGLGNVGGSGLGGNGGPGDLPFSGGFAGEFAKVRFYNYAIGAAVIEDDYNSVHSPAGFGVVSLSGSAAVPSSRPVNLSRGAQESAGAIVVQERQDTLNAPLAVDAVITTGVTLNSAGQATPGIISQGTDIDSYLLQFDPLGAAGGASSGSVTFAGEILGILFDQSSLVSTDALLGSIGNYGEASDRGLTLGPEGMLSVSADLHELSFNFAAAQADMIQIRILTTAMEVASQGDFDGDGDVDGRDFLMWQRGESPNPFSAADLAEWQNAYGTAASSNANVSVPEPATAMLLALAALCAHVSRRS